jgi:DNA polymerase I-like protein with 3'-5' exonuclease and polymerase domains
MDKCETFGKFSTDIELINSRRSITCFSLSCENSSGICIPLIDELGQAMWTEKEEYAIWDRYGRLIENENISKCNQNIAFDATEITRLLGFIFKGPIQCTMTGFSILYPNFPADLGFISSIYTDIPYFKADSGKVWLNKTLKIDNYKEFLRYNALDAIAAFEAWHGNDWTNGIEQDLKDQDFWRTYELTMEPFEALTYMMNRGIRVDQKAIESLDNEVSNTIRSLRKRLCDIIGKDFNPSSPKQCLEYFYERCQIQPYKNIKTGKPSTDDKALSRIARRDLGDPSEVAKTIMQIRTLEKQKKSYLDCQWSEDGRIRCSWKARGTIFGRFASSKTIYNEGLNFQNLDPEFAGFLVAD